MFDKTCARCRGEYQAECEDSRICPTCRLPFGEWQPIETARYKQSVLLGRKGTGYVMQAYRTGPISGWRHMHSGDPICFEPTHWMPMPRPPK